MEATPQENAALVRQFLMDVVVGGDIGAVEVLLTEGAVDHGPVFEAGVSHDSLTALGWRVLAAAEVDIDIDDVVATTDRVAVRGTISGTHRESLLDLAPTGRSFEIACVWFCRISDGRIAEIWSLPDALGLVRQLDAVPDQTPHRSPTDATEHEL